MRALLRRVASRLHAQRQPRTEPCFPPLPLCAVQDPDGKSPASRNGVLTFPFITIENVDVLDPAAATIVVGNGERRGRMAGRGWRGWWGRACVHACIRPAHHRTQLNSLQPPPQPASQPGCSG